MNLVNIHFWKKFRSLNWLEVVVVFFLKQNKIPTLGGNGKGKFCRQINSLKYHGHSIKGERREGGDCLREGMCLYV